MAISLTQLLGTDVVAASRSTINSNFTLIEDEVNILASVVNTTTKAFDNSAETNGTVTTKTLTVTTNGVNVQNGNLTISTGDQTITAGDLTLTAGAAILSTGNLQVVSGDIQHGGRVINTDTPEEFASSGAITVSSSLVYVDDDAYTVTLADGTQGQLMTVIHKGLTIGTVTITPANFTSTSVVLTANDSVVLQFLDSKWYVISGQGYSIT